MVNVYDKTETETVSEIVRSTLKVAPNGSVVFRARRGKGSGKAIEIPGDQFDRFVDMMRETADCRAELAEKAREDEPADGDTESVEG